MFKFVLCLAVLAVSLSDVRAKLSKESEQALAKYLYSFMDACGKELNVNADEIKAQHKATGTIEGIDKCFLGCVLKKEGSITEEGTFDINKSLTGLRGVIKNDVDYKRMETVLNACISVNDANVSDGAQGCERSYLLLTCIKKEKENQN